MFRVRPVCTFCKGNMDVYSDDYINYMQDKNRVPVHEDCIARVEMYTQRKYEGFITDKELRKSVNEDD